MTVLKRSNEIDALLGTDDTKWMTPKMVKTAVDVPEIGGIRLDYYNQHSDERFHKADGTILDLDEDEYRDYLSIPGVQHWALSEALVEMSGHANFSGAGTRPFSVVGDYAYTWLYYQSLKEWGLYRISLSNGNYTKIYKISHITNQIIYGMNSEIIYRDGYVLTVFATDTTSGIIALVINADDGAIVRQNTIGNSPRISDFFEASDGTLVIDSTWDDRDTVIISKDLFSTYQIFELQHSSERNFSGFNGCGNRTASVDIFGLFLYYTTTESIAGSNNLHRVKFYKMNLETKLKTLLYTVPNARVSGIFYWLIHDENIYINITTATESPKLTVITKTGSIIEKPIKFYDEYSFVDGAFVFLSDKMYLILNDKKRLTPLWYIDDLNKSTLLAHPISLVDSSWNEYGGIALYDPKFSLSHFQIIDDNTMVCGGSNIRSMLPRSSTVVAAPPVEDYVKRPFLIFTANNQSFYMAKTSYSLAGLNDLVGSVFFEPNTKTLIWRINRSYDYFYGFGKFKYSMVRLPNIAGGYIRLK